MSSPLVNAVKHGDILRVKHLLAAGADPNEGARGVSMPLWVAAHRGNTPMVALLLEAGAKATSHTVHAAAFANHANTLRVLLIHGAPTDPPGTATPLLNRLKYSGFSREDQKKVRQLILDAGGREIDESHLRWRWSVRHGWRWRLRRFAFRLGWWQP
jgi:ankyrin repeat protein